MCSRDDKCEINNAGMVATAIEVIRIRDEHSV